MRLLLALVICVPLLADEEASNRPVVKASEYGGCYAKSVPAEGYGNVGTTRIYRVADGDDELLQEYGWYSSQIYLACNASDSTRPWALPR